MARCYNIALEEHKNIDVGHGVIVPLPKPGKVKGPPNSLRPVTLLTTFRKVLAIIVTLRVKARFELKLPPSQAGARPSRSTTDGVFVKMMLVAISAHYNVHIHSLGTDIAQAFDKVDRACLLTFLEEDGWMGPDELRMTRLLLANTTIQVRVSLTLSSRQRTSAGTIQGDALSMLLFVAYLAGAQRGVLRRIKHNIPDEDLLLRLPDQTAYVDDVDHISTSQAFLQHVLDITKEEFLQWELRLNLDKTERVEFFAALPSTRCPSCTKACRTSAVCCDQCNTWWHAACANVSRESFADFVADPSFTWICPMCLAGSPPVKRGQEKWRESKHLGICLDMHLETSRRIQKAGWAYAALQKLWIRRDLVSEDKRVRLFKAFVLPHFLYCLGALPLTVVFEKRLDAAHRRLLRRLLRVCWPTKVSNDELYKRTTSEPISVKAREMRWSYLGHVLRRIDEQHPAARAFLSYFKCSDLFKRVGQIRSDIVSVLRRDLESSEYVHGLMLKDMSDAEILVGMASDRMQWAGLVREICHVL